MAIIRREPMSVPSRAGREWDPIEMMRDLLRWDRFQELAPRLWREERMPTFAPDFDVRETKDAYVFRADLPGMREQDVEVSLTGERLSISGKREEEKVEERETWFCNERSFGSFVRTFTLPAQVNPDQIRAEMKDGVLTVHVPKTAEAETRRIPVGGEPTRKAKA